MRKLLVRFAIVVDRHLLHTGQPVRQANGQSPPLLSTFDWVPPTYATCSGPTHVRFAIW